MFKLEFNKVNLAPDRWVSRSGIKFLVVTGVYLLLPAFLLGCGGTGDASALPSVASPPYSASPNLPNTAPSSTNSLPDPSAAAPSVGSSNNQNRNTGSTPGQNSLPTSGSVVVTPSGAVINMKLELARTQQQQETGLMGRTSLPPDTGMLFIFPGQTKVGFWMKDTLLPLSIAWIDEQGKFLEIQDMEALSEQVHTPAQAYIWALEVPKGYFSQKGITAGSILKLNRV